MRLAVPALLLLGVLSSAPSFAADPAACAAPLQQMLPRPEADLLRELTEAAAQEGQAFRTRAWELWQQAAQDPAIAQVLPRQQVLELVADAEMASYPRNLAKVLETALQNNNGEPLRNRVFMALRENLRDNVPTSQIERRLEALALAEPNSLRRALGDLELAEVRELYVGANPLSPTPDSLVGRYLAESGATSLVRRFPVEPGSQQMGPERLVVAVSAESLPLFKKYFTRPTHFSVTGHNFVTHNGKVSSHSSRFADFRLPGTAHTPLSATLLKTTEAERMDNYFRLLKETMGTGGSWGNPAMQPWRMPGYCATSAYGTCTQWIGNVPVGDRLVTSYRYPGPVDRYGTRLPNDTGGPREAPLAPYAGGTPLFRRVWKAPAGNEQLAYVLGLGAQNERAELTNPGWVISSLLGPISQERVPVVFVVEPNHRTPIPADFKPAYENPL
jgi:hypothetical protein